MRVGRVSQMQRWILGALSTGHRLEDNPGVRRHLVKKPSRIQGGRGSPSGLAPILRRKKKKKKLDRRPHEVVACGGVGLGDPVFLS